ncbi:hypothetical protein J4E85_011123 [Alternaria conjuncta]|uniref:uncharacterized protein n=1 Tax=Alternaria conjuncta TaxID=181017 RepID=UPI00221E95A4|nr:uncharacterized protein J4E85_011123 [Alternaria conjuncta]KAI4912189.1 hypothetical protein J4E85_011123 [Alternaria conjuncta]
MAKIPTSEQPTSYYEWDYVGTREKQYATFSFVEDPRVVDAPSEALAMDEQLFSLYAVHCDGVPTSTGFVSPLPKENHEEVDEFHDDTLSDEDFLGL